MRTCLIINPNAGRKAGLTTNALGLEDVSAALARHYIDTTVLPTEHAGHATDLARQAAADGYELIVAAGGDGTVTEVASGMLESDAVLGVMPLGSVMNIARMLGVPRDLDAAARVIAERRIVRIDVGQASTRARTIHFLEAGGTGVDAALFAYFNEIDRGNWRSLRPLLKFMWRYRPRRVRMLLDGQPFEFRAMMVTISNGPNIGPAWALAPDARIDDGLFDVQVFTRFSKLELAMHLLSIMGGRRRYNPKVLSYRAKRAEIEPRRPMMVHADSQPLATTPATFEVLPGALSVIVGDRADCHPALGTVPAPEVTAPPVPSDEAVPAQAS